jgi:hypothetical protein
MLEFKRGILGQELFYRKGIQGFEVKIDERLEKCIVYPPLSGEARSGDEVILNTTAMSLGLGTGGYHYVIANLRHGDKELTPGGHIMKMRYTPLQLKVMSVEEEASPHRQAMMEADSLDHTPVLVGTLHSILAPMALYLHRQGYRSAYLMTDGAALPLAFSNTVAILKERNIICGSVTAGHAFGGDLEAVNVYSGLLAAKKVLAADVIICAMGPGIVGTGSKWGFTGVEQGDMGQNLFSILIGFPSNLRCYFFCSLYNLFCHLNRIASDFTIIYHTGHLMPGFIHILICLLICLFNNPFLFRDKQSGGFQFLRQNSPKPVYAFQKFAAVNNIFPAG